MCLKDLTPHLSSSLSVTNEALTLKFLNSDYPSVIFRDECSKLRSQLNEHHREENRVSLEELTKIKDLQKDELRAELQGKIDALRKTVSLTYRNT